jgi:superfamily II DNA or RNA helicase
MKSESRPAREARRAKLIRTYVEATPEEQAVLQLLAVVGDSMTRTKLLSVQSGMDIHTDNGRAFAQLDLRSLLESLRKKGLAESSNPRLDHAYWKCHRLILEVVVREAQRSGRFEALDGAAETLIPFHNSFGFYFFQDLEQALRLMRRALYRHDDEELWKLLHAARERYPDECRKWSPLWRLCNEPFDAEWFSGLSEDAAHNALRHILSDAFDRLIPAEGAFAYLRDLCTGPDKDLLPDGMRLIYRRELILRGGISEADKLLEAPDITVDQRILQARSSLLRGRGDEALADYARVFSDLRVKNRKRKPLLPGYEGLFYALALIQSRETVRLRQAVEYLTRALRSSEALYKPACTALRRLADSYLGNTDSSAHHNYTGAWLGDYRPVDLFVATLTDYWLDQRVLEHRETAFTEQHARAVEAGYRWWAAELGALLDRIQPGLEDYGPRADQFFKESGTRPLVDLVHHQERWALSLEALEHVAESAKVEPGDVPDCRMTWHLTPELDVWRVEAREVRRLQSGRLSKGKSISLKRLYTERAGFPYLTPQDTAVCTFISAETESRGYYGSPRVSYELPMRALTALVGHPLVFGVDGEHLEVAKGEPELRVSEQGGQVLIELVPSLGEEQEVAVAQESHTRIRVIECAPEHRRMAGIIKKGLRVPIEHKARVLESLGKITSLITIHSDIGGGLENVPMIPEDSRPHIMLTPSGQGLRVQVLVRPLAEGGAYYRPGAGGETVLAEVEGRPVQTRRSLAAEKELAERAIAACTVLARAQEFDGEWLLEDPEDCLELLDELGGLGETVLLEWPQGQKMRISGRAASGSLQLKVAGAKNWFEATGQLRVDDDRVLDMRQLLDLLDETRGRFVPLGDGQFLALTKEFRKRLDELRAISEEHGRGVRFHALAAPTVESLLEGAGALKSDKAWKEHIARFRDAQDFEPALPSTLRAELRDYQVQGYWWMARLARWGAGACLADDMGLGKTVQALTLILAHAPEGPAIAVAPTSVCMNWIDEARRFAPTLNPILFGAGDRQAALDALKPLDLLVCSYGLLYQESEKLSAVRWRVAVLDEAQAIKNFATRRSQAAMNLRADFRVITTGTPIENHLGELWNLFRFINPGLLGSLEQFSRRFAAPIERHQDREARTRLKKVIQPFMLRRLKEQVLEELPSRTEILLHVERSAEETAFYEALRRKVIEKIACTKGPPAQKHLMILAEIMRLRRACCNAQLVTPEINIASSKLAVFLDLVEELIENRHKALVFSQFVDHLSILRKELDQKGVAYQYLDGSTPQRERKRRVDAFQGGEGDLFLISLKAGGLGLNLTAADYVIHMDPWWNPAVEDQASDRAHRIGQLRPVTIYRLVTKDTIESKIVDLHRHKRDLADSLLEGSDMTGKMSAEDLLALLQEGF